MTEIKLCILCKHRVETGGFLFLLPPNQMCGHPNFISMVDGRPDGSCYFTRENEHRCGKEGKFFEPKVQ